MKPSLKFICEARSQAAASANEAYKLVYLLDSDVRNAQTAALVEHFKPAFVSGEGMEAGLSDPDNPRTTVTVACCWDASAMRWSARLCLTLTDGNLDSVLTWRCTGDCPAVAVRAAIAELHIFSLTANRPDLGAHADTLNATIWKDA